MKVQELDDSLDMITRNTERLKQLSSEIIDVAKIEGNSLDLELCHTRTHQIPVASHTLLQEDPAGLNLL